MEADEEAISSIEGIGPVIAKTFRDYFSQEGNRRVLEHLMSHLELEEVAAKEEQTFQGLNFVITGSVIWMRRHSCRLRAPNPAGSKS